MKDIQKVYYFPIDAKGNEIEDPIRIGLKEDGSADLSGLPDAMRETLERMGTPDASHSGEYYPKDGVLFLRALVTLQNPYARFRIHAEKR